MKRRRAEITRLAGMTNLVFKVEAGRGNFLFRIPGAGTEAYINREGRGGERGGGRKRRRVAGGAPFRRRRGDGDPLPR